MEGMSGKEEDVGKEGGDDNIEAGKDSATIAVTGTGFDSSSSGKGRFFPIVVVVGGETDFRLRVSVEVAGFAEMFARCGPGTLVGVGVVERNKLL